MQFPEAGEFEIHSHPIFLLSRGDDNELLIFEASMSVRTAEPLRHPSGKRHVPIEVASWRARARSELLGSEIELTLSEGPQPRSRVIAGGDPEDVERDLPGRLEFNMNWTASVDGTIVASDLDGRAVGNITSFPPRGDVFQMENKALTIGDVRVQPVACACFE